MQEKIKKFEDILESELDKEMDRIISAKTITPADVKTVTDAVRLMLKVKEYEEWCMQDNPENSFDGYSMRRGRSPMTGRYISRDYGPSYEGEISRRFYGDRHYNSEYSGHNMKDRILDKLDDLYHEAHDEKDRQMLDEWIGRLTNSRY